MYRKFNIEGIQASLLEKTIYIKATLDLDRDSVTKDLVEISEKESKRIPSVNLETEGQYIKLVLQEWPVPNAEYILIVRKGVKSVLGDELPASLRRQVIFTSEITSLVNILYPANFEEIESPHLKWTENPNGAEAVDSYYLEVAEENAFYNIVRKTHVHGEREIVLKHLDPGQYYARARAERDGEYGPWSETVTFVLVASEETEEQAEDDDGPVLVGRVELVDPPANGETPDSFVIRFNCEIDPDEIEIVVSRREI